MVGETAEAMNRLSLAIFSISPLTSNLTSCRIGDMRAKKNPNAVALGKLGGRARAASLSESERSAIASKAGKARSEKLSAADRSRIAKLAVQARERKRRHEKHDDSRQ